MNNIISIGPGKKFPLSGNQAAARGAVEAGVNLAAGYPGTPATQVLDELIRLQEYHNIASLWSINEKVALEVAAAHSWAGYRSLVSTTASGLNAAASSLVPIASIPAEGGLIIYVADDPGSHFGQIGQDSRYYARLAHLPMLEPSTPQEVKDWIVKAFQVSHKARIPIIVRVTTSLAQAISPVVLGDQIRIRKLPSIPSTNAFTACLDSSQCLEHLRDIEERCYKAADLLNDLSMAELSDSEIGVVTCGATDPLFREFLNSQPELNTSILKLALTYPPPVHRMVSLLEHCQTVVVLEEMEPMLETALLSEAERLGGGVRVVGKRHRPDLWAWEYDYSRVALLMAEAAASDPRLQPINSTLLHKATATEPPRSSTSSSPAQHDMLLQEALSLEPRRPPTFCSGCPHRATYYAIGRALLSLGWDLKDVVITGDLGCGMIGKHEPFPTPQIEVSMGASIGLALGLHLMSLDRAVIAVIGDGSLFHSGLPALLEAVHRQANITLIILDNGCNAITGCQKNPGSDKEFQREEDVRIDIVPILRAIGVRTIRRASPYAPKKMIKAILDVLSRSGPRAILAQAPCAQMVEYKSRSRMMVRSSRCVGVDACQQSCVHALACPSLEVEESGKVSINASTCIQCGLCKDVCPHHAIRRSWGKPRVQP